MYRTPAAGQGVIELTSWSGHSPPAHSLRATDNVLRLGQPVRGQFAHDIKEVLVGQPRARSISSRSGLAGS